MKRVNFRNCNRLQLKNRSSTETYSARRISSKVQWKRSNIDDYTCDWSFPIRTLVGKGRRNDVIKELRSNHRAARPLVVSDSNVENLSIVQV